MCHYEQPSPKETTLNWMGKQVATQNEALGLELPAFGLIRQHPMA